jgi:hypothetical protein
MILEESVSRPDRRKINFLFNASGNSGKSILADYMELNPECKTLLALQLATSERYVAALIDQFENYQKRHNEYPRTIIFDFTRNEDNIASRESIPLNS